MQVRLVAGTLVPLVVFGAGASALAAAPKAKKTPQVVRADVNMRWRTTSTDGSLRLTQLTVGSSSGARVRVACTAARCPTESRAVGKSGSVLLHAALDRLLPAGTRISVRVTSADHYGQEGRYRVVGGKIVSLGRSCLAVGSTTKHVKCPAASRL